MDTIQCMIEALKAMRKSGITTLEIYYAEIIEDPKIWSVDVMNNHLNNICEMSWTWTVISSAEDKIYREEFDGHEPLAEYEIIVHDEDFSDDVVCSAIESWLVANDLEYLGFDVKLVDFDTTEYSGYVKNLIEMDIDGILTEAKPFKLEELAVGDNMIKEGLKTDVCPRCGLIAVELIYRDEYIFCPRCWKQWNFKLKETNDLPVSKNIFNDIELQTTCKVCGSKMSGQFVIGDNTIYLLCETCEDNDKHNGFHYVMICDIEEYKKKLKYLQIIKP